MVVIVGNAQRLRVTYTLLRVSSRATILLIDDDPSHLKLYSWIVSKGGFGPLTALVAGSSLDLPSREPVDLSILDYRLGTAVTSAEVAQRLQQTYPSKPILILSDMQWMPDDVAPFAHGFVRKGEPEQLLQKVSDLLRATNRQA